MLGFKYKRFNNLLHNVGCNRISDEEKLVETCADRDSKRKKLPNNRLGPAIFFGVALGFIISFMVAYSSSININNSVIDDNTSRKNSLNDGSSKTTNLAEFLRSEVKVFCLVMTTSNAVNERAKIIMDTWGKRCNKLLFFSDQPDKNFTNVIALSPGDKMERLREAFKHVYMNYIEDFDWILKTNDNSYVVLENLRHLLYQYDTDWPVVVGQRFLKEDYMIDDFALSKRAFIRLLEHGFTNSEICAIKGNDELEIANCLEHVNVIKVDAIDGDGRGRFFRNSPESGLFPDKFDDYDKWYRFKFKQGIDNCCSDRLILIQKCDNFHLYYYEYYIYKVRVFGRQRNREPLPEKRSIEDIVLNNI